MGDVSGFSLFGGRGWFYEQEVGKKVMKEKPCEGGTLHSKLLIGERKSMNPAALQRGV